jgi:hypothetical protein
VICSDIFRGVKSLDNEMAGSCGTYGGEQKLIQDTGEGNLRKEATCKT